MPAASSNPASVVIIGGGISGLACAFRLKQLNIPFLLLEASDHFGGVIHTIRENGYLFEFGPQGIMLTPELSELISAAGLSGQLLHANPSAPRYIYRGGRLVRAPMSPFSLLGTPLLSAGAKWRLLTEPLRHTHPPTDDESVANFVRRKFVPSLLENLVGPFVSGIYAGDPEKLSLRAAFPYVHEWETNKGSILRGAIAQRRSAPKAAAGATGLHTIRDGIGSLLATIGAQLGAGARLNSSVDSITRTSNASTPYSLTATRNGVTETLDADAVIIATEPDSAGRILGNLSPKFPAMLEPIPYAAVAVVAAGYRREAVGNSLNGFGFLVPRKEGLRTLGTVWNSFLFPNRAPEGHVTITTFAGGITDPDLPTWPEQQIATTIHEEQSRILKISAPPVITQVHVYQRALPQYNLGHTETISALNKLCSETPGIFLAGNYLEGPALGACVSHSFKISGEVAAFIRAGHL